VDHDLPDLPDRALEHQRARRVDARVPRGLEVGQEVDAVPLGEGLHGQRLAAVERERLLHHDVDAPRCAGLDDRAVLVGRPEGGHRLRLRRLEHLLERREEDPIVHAVPPGVAHRQLPVRLGDPDDPDIAPAPPEDPVHVRVAETGDPQAERPRRGRPGVEAGRGQNRRDREPDPPPHHVVVPPSAPEGAPPMLHAARHTVRRVGL
jgi:hypothetical protein